MLMQMTFVSTAPFAMSQKKTMAENLENKAFRLSIFSAATKALTSCIDIVVIIIIIDVSFASAIDVARQRIRHHLQALSSEVEHTRHMVGDGGAVHAKCKRASTNVKFFMWNDTNDAGVHCSCYIRIRCSVAAPTYLCSLLPRSHMNEQQQHQYTYLFVRDAYSFNFQCIILCIPVNRQKPSESQNSTERGTREPTERRKMA